jgi:hypothetical protein
MADRHDERIKEKARELWEQEGKPQGRDADFLDMATELVAIEDNQNLTTIPVQEPMAAERDGEPIEALENEGEFPTLTDQGEQEIPHRPGADKR